jgi:hypothetical protein
VPSDGILEEDVAECLDELVLNVVVPSSGVLITSWQRHSTIRIVENERCMLRIHSIVTTCKRKEQAKIAGPRAGGCYAQDAVELYLI